MENTNNGSPRRPVRRRRKRNPVHVFIQTYLPVLVVAVLVILFIMFVSGSIRRSNARREQKRQESIAAEQSEAQYQLELQAEAVRLAEDAQALADMYDYDGAVALLDSFSGNLYDFGELHSLREACITARDSLVAWEDPSEVVNLSFHLLIVDPGRAFRHEGYSSSFQRNFITVTEFNAILQQLYDNGYILVDRDDLFSSDSAEGFSPKTLYLPQGKKPLMLTQTHVNYYTYMTDGDGDGLADKDGAGFASRLILDDSGKLTCEYVDGQGQRHTGPYDMVPILDDFIAAHPDFSYQGARATLAVSGYDGLFGYRTDPETAQRISQEYYDQQLAEVPAVINALREAGYTIACYTYNNLAYGNISAAKIKDDLDRWQAEVAPLLGPVDTLVFAKESDISDTHDAYSGDKYNILKSMGLRYFLGFCGSGEPWATVSNDCVRMGRILVDGNHLTNHASLFEGLFDAASVLDPSR